MAAPATPAPEPPKPYDVTPAERPVDPRGSFRSRLRVDLQWRPVWRGDEPDEIDRLLSGR